MPRNITVTFADGSQHVYQGAPDDVTPDQVEARAAKEFGKKVTALDGGRQAVAPKEEPGMLASLGAGLGKGVGQVALNVQKYAGKGIEALGGGSAPTLSDLVAPGSGGNIVQRAGRWLQTDADSGLKKIEGELAPYKEANPISAGAGELGGQVAATLPIGGVLAKVASKLPGVSAGLASAIQSGGFVAPGANMLTRAAGGAITGGAQSALVDPNIAGEGAILGGLMPGAAKVAGMAGNKLSGLIGSTAESLMQSAIKPTIAQLKSGEAATAVRTLLDYGISPTKAGVNKLRALIDDLNTQIADKVANSGATIDKANVLNALGDVRSKFATQVAPQGDLAAIQNVADNFAAHPGIPGNDIPVQMAQDLKQGTYKVLSKKYGQLGSAETEAQKGLARGLKEEIATAVPGVSALNAEESRLIQTLSVAERRALMDLNKNPMGLAALASNPIGWAAFMADRSAAFKALAARMADSTSNGLSTSGAKVQNLLANPLARTTGLLAAETGQ